jgi:hypothetical protein
MSDSIDLPLAAINRITKAAMPDSIQVRTTCYSVVTLLLRCCYIDVTLLYTAVILLLHCCYIVVTLLSHFCYTAVHCCYTVGTAVSNSLHCCYTVVTQHIRPASCRTHAGDNDNLLMLGVQGSKVELRQVHQPVHPVPHINVRAHILAISVYDRVPVWARVCVPVCVCMCECAYVHVSVCVNVRMCQNRQNMTSLTIATPSVPTKLPRTLSARP